MAKRTARDYEATLEQQMKQFKPVRVNPFPMMMDAARHHQGAAKQDSTYGPAAAAAPQAVPQPALPCTMCSHCGVGLSELQVQQCHACKSVYCSSCSVINYDHREDRVFCLDCNTDGDMQLTSCGDDPDFACGPDDILFDAFNQHHTQQHTQHYHHQQHYHQQYQHHQQQQQQYPLCSPPGRDMLGDACHAAALSSERRSSVVRACNMAAAAAAAAADSGGSCLAGMSGISGLGREQMTPLFAQGGLYGGGLGSCGGGGGGSGGGGSGGGSKLRGRVPGVLGQWDLNSPPLSRIAQGVLGTPAVLPFTAGC